jgi:hypothetical protein
MSTVAVVAHTGKSIAGGLPELRRKRQCPGPARGYRFLASTARWS